MNERLIRITGRDPLLFGDGRPFTSDGSAMHARTLPFPLPSTVAGMVRTFTGDQLGWEWKNGGASRAREMTVAGPLLVKDGKVMFSAPADALPGTDGWMDAMLPQEGRDGCSSNLPAGLRPVVARAFDEGKRPAVTPWWPENAMLAWLAGEKVQLKSGVEDQLQREERVHVAMDAETGRGKDGALFATTGLSFGRDASLLARVLMDDEPPHYRGLSPFGGERRLAVLEDGQDAGDIRWPDGGALARKLKDGGQGSRGVRMVLATPAVFTGGWKPGWLDERLEGTPPGLDGARFRLVGAALPRRQAVSGWDYEKNKARAVRWMAPAGSVYFFEAEEGELPALLENAWLTPVSDGEQDRRDGFGLALWGVWNADHKLTGGDS